MSRARHRLARRQDAVVNQPTQSIERSFTAFIDADTCVRHVLDDGTLSDIENFSGNVGNTGRTSDAFHASWYLQQFQSRSDRSVLLREQEGFLRVGAILSNEADDLNVGGGRVNQNTNTAERMYWPWTYQVNPSGSTQSGWLESLASRVYMVCNLNSYGDDAGGRQVIPMAAGDVVTNATLKMTIQNKIPHIHGGNSPYGGIPLGQLQGDKEYCVYKCVKGISTGNLADVTWFGFSGGTLDCVDFWDTPGGNHDGNDITDLGTVTCTNITPFGGGGGDGDTDDGPDIGDTPEQRGGGGVINGGENTTITWDITHIVQDAVDNESNVLRLALYGADDTNTTNFIRTVQFGSSPQLEYRIPVYTFANNAVDFFSKDQPPNFPSEDLPQIDITFIDRT